MHINPYLIFEGRCDEAIEFYKIAVGAEVKMLTRFKAMPNPPPGSIPPGGEEKIMHAALKIGDSMIFASDGYCRGTPKFEGISLSIDVAHADEAERIFNGLANGGKITMPLGKTFFASSFGMLVDRFGVSWMVIAQP